MLFASFTARFRGVKLELLDMLKASGFEDRTVMDVLPVHDVRTVLEGIELITYAATTGLVAAVSAVIARVGSRIRRGAGRQVGRRGCRRGCCRGCFGRYIGWCIGR